MEPGAIHELTAPYALDALDEPERREFEEHLRTCEPCREELASLQAAAGALAYAVEGSAPPEALRGRILEQVRAERGKVVPLRRPRVVLGAVGGLAAAAAAAAIGFGIWSASLSDELDRTRAALDVLADPAARSVELEGAAGRLVVGEDGRAALVVRGLEPAPAGKTYEIWVIEERPRRAGLFDEAGEVVLLDRRVPEDATVAVTVEDDGGVDAPTSEPVFSAQT